MNYTLIIKLHSNVLVWIWFSIISIQYCCSSNNIDELNEPKYPFLDTKDTMDVGMTFVLKEDSNTLLRNPCMGWGLYDDANDEVQNADEYWKIQDEAARDYASFFYVRWRWSDIEPIEGQYAWEFDENFKKLIRGAIDRGLKLCFRIYNNGKDNIRAGTPDFVREAGAKGYYVDGFGYEHWTPYPDDPIFQEKLANFVEAFAEEFDDPTKVDFIDGYALGWWGECHNIKLQDPSNLKDVFDWYTSLYSSNFKNIILALPFGSQVGFETENEIAISKKGYAMRRDGLGSMWFSDEEQKITDMMYGETLLIGESCWWGCSDDDCTPFASDTQYDLNTWRDVYELTYSHAVENHFNTLDLREIPETEGWTQKANDLVNKFVRKGGYRFYPLSITLPDRVMVGEEVSIRHSWINRGTGYLPNNNPNWNYKYKPAFALFNEQNEIVKIWIDENAEPSDWLYDEENSYKFDILDLEVDEGKYKWGVAIIDKTRKNTPGIKLAVENEDFINGWTVLGQVVVAK